jgi:hypothetical protein
MAHCLASQLFIIEFDGLRSGVVQCILMCYIQRSHGCRNQSGKHQVPCYWIKSLGMAAITVSYVDDLHSAETSEEECWLVQHQTSMRLSYVN